ncbi:hypothetical protein [Dokdonia sp.]|uniref:hypothetical protein n=1 Tax=Dokdonia sp. TaxID=2024995 RepID=UPI003267969E
MKSSMKIGVLFVLLFCSKGMLSQNCMRIDGQVLEASEKEYVEATSDIRAIFNKVQDWFDRSIVLRVVKEYDGACYYDKSTTFSDGLVEIGADVLDKFKDRPDIIELLLVHEIAHSYNVNYKENRTTYNELLADMITGYYIGIAHDQNNFIYDINSEEYGNYFGDYYFDMNSHHGKPSIRNKALQLGFFLTQLKSEEYHGTIAWDLFKMKELYVDDISTSEYDTTIVLLKSNTFSASSEANPIIQGTNINHSFRAFMYCSSLVPNIHW